MRLVFIGATQFGYRCLQELMSLEGLEVTGVVTLEEIFKTSYSKEPIHNVMYVDFPAYCKTHKVPCYLMQNNMREPALMEHMQEWRPDLIVVVGWYHIVPENIRTLPPMGTIGFHASLLPKYRGCAPLVWAMIQGEREVGLSLFFLESGIDTGALVAQKKIPVLMKDTIATVYKKVEETGLEILRTSFLDYVQGRLKPVPQSVTDSGFKGWPPRLPKDGYFSWASMSPIGIYNYIRAQTNPYPGAYCYWGEDKITIWEAYLYPYDYTGFQPGEVIRVFANGEGDGILVATTGEDIPLLLKRISINDKEVGEKEMLAYFSETAKKTHECKFG